MQAITKLKAIVKALGAKFTNNKKNVITAADRIARLERNYLVLLKRVLEMDGVSLNTSSKASSMDSKIFQTAGDDSKNNGLNEPKPTLH